MSDHEFEKQVRQKLDDLKLTPSAAAWKNIEHGLRNVRRRRAPLLWLPLLFIGMAAGGYFIINTADEGGETKGKGQRANGERGEAKGKGQTTNGKRQTANDTDLLVISSPTKSGEKSLQPEVAKGKGQTANGKRQTANDTDLLVISSPTKSGEKSLQPEVAKGKRQTVNGKRQTANDTDLLVISSTTKSGEKTSPLYHSPLKTDIVHYNYLINAPQFNSSITGLPVLGKKKFNRWKFGISAFVGVSSVNKGNLLDFRKAAMDNVSLTPAFNATVFAPSYTPTAIFPGLSYSIGGTVKTQLSNRISLSSGMNYLQLNTRHKVGQQYYSSPVANSATLQVFIINNNNTVDQDRSTEYRNRYHYLELPVNVHVLLNRSRKLPLEWNAGLSVSRLLTSNSVHFDGLTGAYYNNDKKLLNRTQAAVSTGFSFSLLNHTTKPLWVGPSARYNVSSILKKDVSATKNFISLGVDMKWFIR